MPLLWLAGGFVLGVIAGREVVVPWLVPVLLLVALASAAALLRPGRLPIAVPAVIVLGLLLGVLRSGPDILVPQGQLPSLHGTEIEVTGRVNGLPEQIGSRIRMRVEMEEVQSKGRTAVEMQADVLVWADLSIPALPGRDFPYLRHGDRFRISGWLDEPRTAGAFDLREDLAADGIGSVITRGEVLDATAGSGGWRGQVHDLRVRLHAELSEHLPEPQASLTAAVLLGRRGGLSADLSEDIRRSGLAHLLAISGLHVGLLLVATVTAAGAVLGRRRGAYLAVTLLAVWAYVLLAGVPPSAVRAAIMGSAFILALATGRAAVPLNALGLAALAIVALDPAALWDRSFQLSFAAMTGVLVIGLPLWSAADMRLADRGGASWRLSRPVAAGVLVSLGANVTTLPLVAYNFGQLPALGIPATLAAMPLLPLLIAGGAAAALTGLVAGPLALVAAVPAVIAGWFVPAIARVTSTIPGAAHDISGFSGSWVWLAYLLLGAVALAVIWRRWIGPARMLAQALWIGPEHVAGRLGMVAAIGLVAALPWGAVLVGADGDLHVHILDVGQGDATLLVTPLGQTILVDGGVDPRVTLMAVDDALPVGRRTIDVAVLTHPHADHANGLLEMVRRGRVRDVLAPPVLPGADASWRVELERAGVGLIEAQRGMLLRLGAGVALEVLNPPEPPFSGTSSDIDNNSIVIRAVHGSASLLLAGDLFADGELALLSAGVDLDAGVLKVPHHGSGRASSAAFLAAVSPDAAVASADIDHPLGHPHAEAVERLLARVPEDQLYVTGTHGTVHFVSDGEDWRVSTERD